VAYDASENGLGLGQENDVKRTFGKLSKVEQERIELKYHRTPPESLDKVMARISPQKTEIASKSSKRRLSRRQSVVK
jgi:hypothetical protein